MSCHLVRLGAAAAALCCAGTVSAAVITYDLRGTIVGSPLDGQVFEGYFSAAEGPDGLSVAERPLVDLAFRFDGRTYTEDDVVGAALFTLRGVRSLFGTACGDHPIYPGSISCDLSTTGDNWYVGVNDGAAWLGFAVRGVAYAAGPWCWVPCAARCSRGADSLRLRRELILWRGPRHRQLGGVLRLATR
jgi:hypothetical protein